MLAKKGATAMLLSPKIMAFISACSSPLDLVRMRYGLNRTCAKLKVINKTPFAFDGWWWLTQKIDVVLVAPAHDPLR